MCDQRKQRADYSEFDRLLDEIDKIEDNLLMEIKFLTQRLSEAERKLQNSITEVKCLIDGNGVHYKAL